MGDVPVTLDASLRTSLFDRLHVGTLALDMLLVSGVALVLGLIRLGVPALWYDEAYTVTKIRQSFGDQIEGLNPLYYTFLKPWTTLAGTSEWALRFPSVVGAMLACALMVVLARKLFDRNVALLAGLFLATSPFFVKWYQQARIYPFVVVMCLLATLALLRALDRGSRGAWALYGLAFAAMVMTHGIAGILLAPVHAVLIVQRRERAIPHALLAAAIVAAIGIPWIAQLAIRTDADGSETGWIPYPEAEVAARALVNVSGVAGLGLLLSILGVWALRRAGDAGVAIWLASWAVGPFVCALLLSLVRPMFLDRYLVVSAPAFAMLAAVAVMSVTGRLRVAIALTAVVATFAGLVLWYGSDEPGNWRGEDWRSAVATVVERRVDADAVVVAPWWAHDAAEYYGARPEDTSSAESIWVLHWSEGDHALAQDVRRPLGFGDHELVEKHQFGWRVSAQLWKRPESGE